MVVGKMVNIKEILQLTQEELLDFCYTELLKRNYKNNEITYTDDYVYARGNIPVLLVAHCDIVHKTIPETIVYDKQQQILWSPTGIGGDDRCGVFALLKISEKLKPYLLFTTDEEIGGVGVKKFTKDFDEIPVNFIIEIDRRGNNQVVFYDCGNKEFQNYIISFGFDKKHGTYSDVSTLSTTYDIAGCNLSAGYYNEHTTTEHIIMEHLYNTIKLVNKILKDTKNHKFYDCQEIKYTPRYNYSNLNWYNSYEKGGYNWITTDNKKQKKKDKKNKIYIEEDFDKIADMYDEPMTEAEQKELTEWVQREDDFTNLTKEEWKEKYGKEKPKNILDIYD